MPTSEGHKQYSTCVLYISLAVHPTSRLDNMPVVHVPTIGHNAPPVGLGYTHALLLGCIVLNVIHVNFKTMARVLSAIQPSRQDIRSTIKEFLDYQKNGSKQSHSMFNVVLIIKKYRSTCSSYTPQFEKFSVLKNFRP